MKTPYTTQLSTAALSALAALAITSQTSADTHTWTGATDGDWNDAGNWDIGIPVGGDGLIFSGTSNTTTNNDLAVIGIAGIQFNNTTAGESFSLAGSDINLTGAITTAAVVGDGTIEDTISLRLRPTAAVQGINLGADHNLTISGEIFGPQAIEKLGAGTLTLSAANTYAGGTNIKAGKVIFTNEDAFNNGNITLGIDVGTQELEFGATGMDLSNFTQFQNSSGKKTITLDLAGNATGTMSGTTDIRRSAAGQAEFVIGDGDTLTLSGTVVTQAGGGAGITKEGAGTLKLTNATNTFSGRFYVNEGEVQIADSGRINDQLIEVASGATFRWSSNAPADLGNTYYDGGMSGDGTFIKDGSNSELIVRNFSGASIANMEVHQGTLTGAGSNGALGGATTTNYLGEDGGANNATMKWIGGINGTVTERADIIVQAGTGTKTYAKGNSNDITDNTDITLNGDLTVNASSTGTFTLGGVISGIGALTKTNTGTLELTGDSNYTGNTNVTTGTLALSHASLNNIISSSSIIDVATGATLDVSALGGGSGGLALAAGQTISGSGTVSGDLTIGNGAVLSPGNSPGTLTEIGDVTWADGGTYLWEINDSGGSKGGDPGWDWLSITGTLELGSLGAGGFAIDIDSLAGAIAGDSAGFDTFTIDGYESPFDVDYSFVIATASGGINGFNADNFNLDFSGFSALNPEAGWHWEIIQDGANDLVLQAYAVPEPSSTALLGLGGLALMLRRKRSAA